MHKNVVYNKVVFGVLVTLFIMYNIIVYTQKPYSSAPKMSSEAVKGQTLWQENNCTACHQFYGLGGYLGPDLTNVISNKYRGPAYVRSILNSGIRSMPEFNFSDEEIDAIIAFLKTVDQTGYYPYNDIKGDYTGWIELKYKLHESE